jgi:hypothetical protein
MFVELGEVARPLIFSDGVDPGHGKHDTG